MRCGGQKVGAGRYVGSPDLRPGRRRLCRVRAACVPATAARLDPSSGSLSPCVISDARPRGTWKRSGACWKRSRPSSTTPVAPGSRRLMRARTLCLECGNGSTGSASITQPSCVFLIDNSAAPARLTRGPESCDNQKSKMLFVIPDGSAAGKFWCQRPCFWLGYWALG